MSGVAGAYMGVVPDEIEKPGLEKEPSIGAGETAAMRADAGTGGVMGGRTDGWGATGGSDPDLGGTGGLEEWGGLDDDAGGSSVSVGLLRTGGVGVLGASGARTGASAAGACFSGSRA